MPNDVLLISDDGLSEHDPGSHHPDRPARLARLLQDLRGDPIAGTRWERPEPVSRSAIERVHRKAYVDRIESYRGRSGQLDPDTAVSPASVDVAYTTCGAVVQATTAVVEGQTDTAFALVRPPGHHAEPGNAMGFCLFNTVAVAAAHARAELGCERVLVLDWDVHHGNGTQSAFDHRRDVLFISSHEFPWYPGTGPVNEQGRGEGEGYTVNLPLPPGIRDAEFLAVYRDIVAPIVEQYKPDLMLVSAGFDGHTDDPLANLDLSEQGFATLCAMVRDLAQEHAGGRLVLTLEGGYHLDALTRSVRTCIEVLTGNSSSPSIEDLAGSGGRSLVDELRTPFRRYWSL